MSEVVSIEWYFSGRVCLSFSKLADVLKNRARIWGLEWDPGLLAQIHGEFIIVIHQVVRGNGRFIHVAVERESVKTECSG